MTIAAIPPHVNWNARTGTCLAPTRSLPLPRHLVADGANHRLQVKTNGCPTSRSFNDGGRDGMGSLTTVSLWRVSKRDCFPSRIVFVKLEGLERPWSDFGERTCIHGAVSIVKAIHVSSTSWWELGCRSSSNQSAR